MRHIRLATLAALALTLAVPAFAQRWNATNDAQWLENCRSNWGDDQRGHACEVRDVPVRLAGRAIEVDGHRNGSVRVMAWDGDSVRVTARLQASAPSDAAASDLLREISVAADGRTVKADGPSTSGPRSNWSVSYLLWVPRRFDLELQAENGSIGVVGVSGRINLRTVNGSVQLEEVGGDVRARTQNGSLRVELAGDRWSGAGLDAETQNGSVHLAMSRQYSAQLETGTVNGRINTQIPITVQGRISRSLSVPLNGGGPVVRAMTTNGSVTIARR